MFIGRERELRTLDTQYRLGRFAFFCIYGRRRVGKTELVKEFVKDKKTIFFTGIDDTKESNLARFSSAFFQAQGIETDASFGSFEELFQQIFALAGQEHLVLVIDEYPYLAKSFSGISSLLQVEIDHRLSNTDIFIILCGSSMSFMEQQVMGYESPLYGRRTGQIKLLPFDFDESRLFVPHLSPEDAAVVYGITGGMAKYLLLFSRGGDLREGIIHHFLDPNALLFEEPANLLKQELREPAQYNAIITAVATGSSKINEIETKTHIDSGTCAKYLKNLSDLGIVKRETPILDSLNSRRSIYRLCDGMFRFWYRFVYRHLTQITLGQGAKVYGAIEKQLPDFMGEVFEQICKEYLWKSQLPFDVSDIGRWWGNHAIMKSEQEIDLIAAGVDDDGAIFCECKWRNEQMPESVIDILMEKSSIFRFSQKQYWLFSKSGFTDAARKRAGENIRLISFSEMYDHGVSG
ncbi:MAG: ATP-binding protein [Lachnospiraceae bacterium]|jgi:AAA+ ATPase superfamily predicted ATPase|nr:ATP-binding protein [Lachnospiraceae bacterium]